FRFLLGFERHHRRHAFPRHERRARRRPAGRRLAPAGQNKRAQKSSHGPDAVVHGVGGEGDVAGISGAGGILSRKMERWNDGKKGRHSDHIPSFPHSIVPHLATRTSKLPVCSFTVLSLISGFRSWPSPCCT